MYTDALRGVGIIKPILQLGKLRLREEKLLSWGHMAAKAEPTGSSMHFFTCDAPTVPPPALESPGYGEELPATPGKWTWGPRGCTMGPKHSRLEARPLPIAHGVCKHSHPSRSLVTAAPNSCSLNLGRGGGARLPDALTPTAGSPWGDTGCPFHHKWQCALPPDPAQVLGLLWASSQGAK